MIAVNLRIRCTGCDKKRRPEEFHYRKDGTRTAWCLACLQEAEPALRRWHKGHPRRRRHHHPSALSMTRA